MAFADFTGSKFDSIPVLTGFNQHRIYQCNHFRFGGFDEHIPFQSKQGKSGLKPHRYIGHIVFPM
jgi:hypothetical protein